MRAFASTTASVALLLGVGAVATAVPTAGVAQIGIGVSVGFGPPDLPIYDQPPIPDYGFIWTPGFWAWDNVFGDYYWVPGAWVRPPRVGFLWTPGYWGWNNGAFVFNDGYWGPHIGFYGGVNYGFGYTGDGYEGGYWRGNQLFYNRAVDNLANARIGTVYSKPFANRPGLGNASFSGGPGGIRARPTPDQLAAMHEQHIAATATQARQVSVARAISANRASVNHGKPAVAATQTAGVVTGPGVVAAKAAAVYHRPANAPPARSAAPSVSPTHAAPGPAPGRPAAAHTQPTPTHAAPAPAHAPAQQHPAPHTGPTRPAPPAQHAPAEHPSPVRAGPPPMSAHAAPMGHEGSGRPGPPPAPGPSHAPPPPRPQENTQKHEPPHP